MKNGDHNYEVIIDRGKPGVTIRADRVDICPDGTLAFMTYEGPRTGYRVVKIYAPMTYLEVTLMGEHRD